MPMLSALLLGALAAGQPPMYQYQSSQPGWLSPENRNGSPGQGAKENQGAKGHPYDSIPAHGSITLGTIKGSGVVHRIWMTLSDRSAKRLRALRLEVYWDGAKTPAISVPLGDFFGFDTGHMFAFQNALFASPEGRSFVATVPMPFRHGARFVLHNDADTPLKQVFYDIDFTRQPVATDALYFHANWHHVHRTTPGRAFTLLPKVHGRGRFLGASMAVVTNPAYGDSWWGEGEVKMYLDGDRRHPTLAGTGTEDYVGSGYGLGHYAQRDTGTPIADSKHGVWLFYRYHLPDPIFFAHDFSARLQQIGGAPKATVQAMQAKGAPLEPITIDPGGRQHFVQLLTGRKRALDDAALPAKGWTNFYRSDDVTATVYYYLDRPGAAFDAQLPPLTKRIADLPPAPAKTTDQP
ncbi:glycoside hydrolase family 172 protein [Oleiagrimonas sp. C23AA]|uniref:glycoside hydrolase family 172 protein n=1 Tax=Oleiagrimonas sp. C23AA TaxID=2719047 RepID=UPI0014213A66|nr:glycoside hydrolase family 172 protein [Oleiagrimonas sp. C23AA]NII09274.1 DUF2961 domain-containing protein [Oleiagrimonas sp. C23AA]